MLTIFRRHLKSCKFRSRRFKGCTCPISIEGRLHGEYVRKSLEVRNWESAQKLVRDWEAGEQSKTVGMKEACEKFIADCEARKLGQAQMGKYKLLTRELEAFFPDRIMSGISIEDAGAYRESWILSPISSAKKLERLRTFFRFCADRGWMRSNPAKFLKAPKVKPKPTLPFSESEMEKILWACEVYPDSPKGRRAQVKALILLLRYSGLRIRDAITLRRGAILEGKLFLYTGKTGTGVYIPLPETVLESLKGIGNEEYFFWTGEGKVKSVLGSWERSLTTLFKLAGVKGHAHKFRDNFAVDLLTHGVSVENVAMLLGHEDIRVTQKHYNPWIKQRQDSLERAVKATWG